MGGKCRTANNTVEIKWRASNWGLLQKRFDYKINERDGLTLFSGNIIPTEIIIHWQMKSVKAYLQNKGMNTRAKEENRSWKERGETKILRVNTMMGLKPKQSTSSSMCVVDGRMK